MKAIHVTQYGGPEVLEVVNVPEPVPEKRLLRVKMLVTGYNFHDAATRKGIFPDPPVKDLTGGTGVDLVIDGVGTTIQQSLEAVKTRGLVITYGMNGGVPELMNPFNLLYRSRTLAGADLFDFIESREDLLKRANAAFDGYRQGWLKQSIAHVLPLEEELKAHYLMQDRNLIGKILLSHDA